MQRYEARLVEEALVAHGWNQAEAARQFGVPVRTLGDRMKMLGIRKQENEP